MNKHIEIQICGVSVRRGPRFAYLSFLKREARLFLVDADAELKRKVGMLLPLKCKVRRPIGGVAGIIRRDQTLTDLTITPICNCKFQTLSHKAYSR